MHETLVSSVKGYIDNYSSEFISGWIFHDSNIIMPIRIKFEDNEICEVLYEISRDDVADYYKNDKIKNCGFTYYNKKIGETYFEIEMLIENSWYVIFKLNCHKKLSIINFKPNINKNIPSFIVVDNFYEDPDKVREFALSQTLVSHPKFHKGKRTDEVFLFDGLKKVFEYHINKSIKDWTKYGVNGCFQTCIAGDQLVYHYDLQDYAAIIFLTPDAPPECGTNFYRSKYTKQIKIDKNTDTSFIFKTGFLDSTQFDLVDQVGNVYNRLVIFTSRMIHAASCYFGDNDKNGRLFQMFFFNLEE
jgi:hypothetical protein